MRPGVHISHPTHCPCHARVGWAGWWRLGPLEDGRWEPIESPPFRLIATIPEHSSRDRSAAHNKAPCTDADRARTGVLCVEDHELICADRARPTTLICRRSVRASG